MYFLWILERSKIMDFKVGDVGYSIEDEELGYIMKVEITFVDNFYIEFGNEAIESQVRINEIEGILYETYEEAAKYIKSLGIRPKLLVLQSED
jgi:hypothetical protein